jgi:hypothetical protein
MKSTADAKLCRASIWRYQKAMGLLLYYDQENHQTRRSGCWIDFTAYNLRRIFNLIDHKLLKQYLRILLLYFGTIRAIFNTDCFILIIIKRVLIERSLNVV